MSFTYNEQRASEFQRRRALNQSPLHTSTRRTYDYPVTIAWRLAPWPAGNVNHANDFLDTLRRRLVGLGPITLGGIPVNGVRFAYDGVLARDSRQRHEAVARYLFRAREASANT